MTTFHNIAGYKFAALSDLKALRMALLARCKDWNLKGTILLSTEGINVFVAGVPAAVASLVSELRGVPGLSDLQVKISESAHQPFNRMLVRIKKEIIAFGVPQVDPARYTSPRISPQILKEWLDEGRPVTLLDTRNDYEVKLGTFRNARVLDLKHFRDFPRAIRDLPETLKEQPIVTFCTGGIRCEKAAPFMELEGFKKIFQLDGGILRYFEECGGVHYDGECFVFDQRVGVDPSLHETESNQCFACLTPLTAADQGDSRYVAGRSCPYCFKTSDEQMRLTIAQRHEAIRRITTPLPGSAPYDNFRPITVSTDCDGLRLIEFLCRTLQHVPRGDWEQIGAQRLLLNARKEPISLDQVVRTGERYFQKLPDTIEPRVNPDIEILHEDEAIIILNKPAPLPMHAGGRFNRNTLQYILNQAYYPEKPRPAHRLDANTTGLVLVTRTRHFASVIQPQFARGEVKKRYLVRVHGAPLEDQFSCDAPISAGPGEAGTREVDHESGLAARTEFRVLQRFADATTLLEANPATGRTNQIRVHLWQLGFPTCGDPVYLTDSEMAVETQTLDIEAPPLCLHAISIEFTHPTSRARVKFTTARPPWARASVTDDLMSALEPQVTKV